MNDGSLAALILSVISISISLFTYSFSLRRERKQATLEAYNRLEEEALEYLERLSPAEIREVLKNNRSAEYKELKAKVARIQHFCVGINTRIYDEKVLYKLGKGFFEARLWDRIKPVLDAANKNGEHKFYADTYEVIERMRKRTGQA